MDELYETKKVFPALVSESRSILVLLGFNGIRDFAKKSGLNHETVGVVLGTCVGRYQKHYPVIIQAHEALHSAYLDRREMLNKATRSYIKDWVKRWKKFAVETIHQSESPGKQTKNTLDAQRKRAKVKAALKQTLDALKWE